MAHSMTYGQWHDVWPTAQSHVAYGLQHARPMVVPIVRARAHVHARAHVCGCVWMCVVGDRCTQG